VAAPERDANAALGHAAIEGLRRHAFYPLVQLLERLTGGPNTGLASAPWEERIRFRHDPSLAFSISDVVSVRAVRAPGAEPDADAPAFEVTTSFLGLSGGVSPLPAHLAEIVAQEDPDAPRLRDFLDLFHHRLLSFLYRARARCDMPGGWRSDLADPWSRRVLALLGMDVTFGETPGPLRDWRLLRLAPILAERNVTAHAVEAAVADALEPILGKVGVAVELFAGAWIEIPVDQQCRLGRVASLGDLVVGTRVYDVAGRFRVVIGPLGGELYRRFVGECVLREVEEIVNGLVTEPIEHEVILLLGEDATPALKLGTARMGRNSWLGGRRGQVRVRAESAA
jgi:type VI secretion system protein ImpH